MKNNRYSACTLLAAVAAMMLTSCNDDYLAQDTLSFYEPSSTYNSEAGLKAAMAVCDRHLRYMFTTGNANNCPIATDYLFSDIGIYGKTDANATDLQDDLARKIQPTSGLLGNGDGNHIMVLWEESFNGIKYANTVLSYIDGVTGLSEEVKNAYKGRAYFHRAIKYYNLVFWFGDVPLVTRIIDRPKQNYSSTKKEAILQMLVHDLEFAVQHVPAQAEKEYYGMVNKEACMHLLIKCCLAVGEGTDHDPLYQTQRRAIEQFRADLPDGEYVIYLHFCELDGAVRTVVASELAGSANGTEGSDRQFEVRINGETTLPALDVTASSGVPARPLAVRIPCSIHDGQRLTIDFVPIRGETMLSAIRILKL